MNGSEFDGQDNLNYSFGVVVLGFRLEYRPLQEVDLTYLMH